MLWTLLKIVLFVCLVVAGTWGVGQLMEADGGIRISVTGTEFTLGALESVIALIMLMIAGWLLFKVVGFVVAFTRFALGDNKAINRFFDRRRERKGYDALAEGLMALASGESKLALAKAAKADRLLEKPELTTLLTAQAAEQLTEAGADVVGSNCGIAMEQMIEIIGAMRTATDKPILTHVNAGIPKSLLVL